MSTEVTYATLDKNDLLSDQVRAAADTARASGRIADLAALRDARVRAGKALELGQARSRPWRKLDAPAPAKLFDPAPGMLPEIDRRDLTQERLDSAMYHHGTLIVRNLFSSQEAAEFRQRIDQVRASVRRYHEATKDITFEATDTEGKLAEQAAADALDTRSDEDKGWYLPLGKGSGKLRARAHNFLSDSGSIETFLSPRTSLDLFDKFERLGLRQLVQNYFGDEACVSYQKSVLRRATPLQHPAEWHQDGAFMGDGIQSLNLWVSLTECGSGTESPGMDLIPDRLHEIIPPGENGAAFSWSISGKTVEERYAATEVARPYFAAGDGVFFDHFNLHATSSLPSFSQPRYAIETWFFSKDRCAKNQAPAYW